MCGLGSSLPLGSDGVLEANTHTPPQWETWILRHLTKVTHNTALYTLQLDPRIMLPRAWASSPVWHVSLRAPAIHPGHTKSYGSCGWIVREYTPVSSSQDWCNGKLVLLIKLYETGTMSQILQRRFQTIGKTIEVGQPQDTLHVPSLQVPGCSLCANAPKEKEFGESPKPLHLGLVAGGTGLSPLLQILRLAVESPWEIGGKGGINATLMYSVQTKQDICMKEELEALVGDHIVSRRAYEEIKVSIQVVCCLSRAEKILETTSIEAVDGDSGPAQRALTIEYGRVSTALFTKYMPGCSMEQLTHFVLCGPQSMMDTSKLLLAEAGHASWRVVQLEA
mmetsp:Transcript_48492/g.90311  ORF Transcript_48492/g.90311 Transcript_48492/m.90311 type:complete len:336 (-) Transcript_48492:261-1268(-)